MQYNFQLPDVLFHGDGSQITIGAKNAGNEGTLVSVDGAFDPYTHDPVVVSSTCDTEWRCKSTLSVKKPAPAGFFASILCSSQNSPDLDRLQSSLRIGGEIARYEVRRLTQKPLKCR